MKIKKAQNPEKTTTKTLFKKRLSLMSNQIEFGQSLNKNLQSKHIK